MTVVPFAAVAPDSIVTPHVDWLAIALLAAGLGSMQTVLEEKMSKISEVLLGSLSPFELMLGKLMGNVGVALVLATPHLIDLTGSEARDRMAKGDITAEAYVKACLGQIQARDGQVEAWAHLDPDLALEYALVADQQEPASALQGVSIGLKDIIETEDMPTGQGSPLWEGFDTRRDAASVQALRQAGRKSILVRVETSPEDIHGMHAAEGILTTRGGMTSHAAVVARGMGKPCVSGCGAIRVDYGRGTMSIGSRTFKTGDVITIDGSLGQVLAGRMPMIEPQLSGEFGTLMGWADEVRKIGVRVNGDTPDDARTAVKFGAEGIGLCRTEHMFFEGDRIDAVREMILADNEAGRRAALKKILPYQKEDFVGIFKALKGFPATIRLLDPPLHEFLPNLEEQLVKVTRQEDAGNVNEEDRELLAGEVELPHAAVALAGEPERPRRDPNQEGDRQGFGGRAGDCAERFQDHLAIAV